MSDETKEPERLSHEWHARKFSKCADEWEETCQVAGEQAEDSWRRKAEEHRDLAQKLRRAAELEEGVRKLVECETLVEFVEAAQALGAKITQGASR